MSYAALPATKRPLPDLLCGLLQQLQVGVAQWPHMRRLRQATGKGGEDRTARHTVRLRSHQVLSHVQRSYRERRGLCPDDVQTVQARVLLVLSRKFRCKYESDKQSKNPVEK